jgi:5-(carboxyamino)imidazole ribonucleotide synthase
MSRRFLPGSTIGVMGGGQLGRMFAMAARRMGYRVHVFTPDHDSPAAQFADATTEADYGDSDAVRRFARNVDLLTFEFENIPVETMEWCADEVEVRPAAAIVETAQNRLREKNFFSENGFPVPLFRSVRTSAELVSAVEQIGRAAILKTAAFGYDGKGQQSISSRDLDDVWKTRAGDDLLLERAIDFEKEISVIVARNPAGEMKAFPVGENVHRDHILDFTTVPADIRESVAKEALELARAVAEKLQVIGLVAVEMFLECDGTL